MSITTEESMRDFNMDTVEFLEQTKDSCIIRTSDLLHTLQYMQKCWRKLQELIPDDEDWIEYNILVYKKFLTPNQI